MFFVLVGNEITGFIGTQIFMRLSWHTYIYMLSPAAVFAIISQTPHSTLLIYYIDRASARAMRVRARKSFLAHECMG